jgi:hypothetical protein
MDFEVTKTTISLHRETFDRAVDSGRYRLGMCGVKSLKMLPNLGISRKWERSWKWEYSVC